MLRTIAAGLIVTALIVGPAAAQPSGATNLTPTTTTKHPGVRSNAKSTSRLKQTSTTKTEQIVKHTDKPTMHRGPRHHVVSHRGSGHWHLVGRHHTLGPTSTTKQHTQSNGSHEASKTESNTNTQK